MRGLKKTAPDGADRHTDGHGDSMTNSAQWGRVGEKEQHALQGSHGGHIYNTRIYFLYHRNFKIAGHYFCGSLKIVILPQKNH